MLKSPSFKKRDLCVRFIKVVCFKDTGEFLGKDRLHEMQTLSCDL